MHLIEPNEKLMDLKDLPESTRKQLREIYLQMGAFLNRPEIYENPVEQIEALEYVMQWLWGFPLDKNYHSYWFEVKGCDCPELDNKDNFGIPRRIINSNCRWHGNKD